MPRNSGTFITKAIDVISDAIQAVLSQPGRTILTCLSTVLGVGILVVVAGITHSASIAVTQTFDEYETNTVKFVSSANKSLPEHSVHHLAAVPGVEAAGRLCESEEDLVRSPAVPQGLEMSLSNVDYQLLGVIEPDVPLATESFLLTGDYNKAVVGSEAAKLLGISPGAPVEIQVKHTNYQVVKVLGPTGNAIDYADSVLVIGDMPEQCSSAELVTRVTTGAAEAVARRGPRLIAGYKSANVVAHFLPAPKHLAGAVEERMIALSLGIGVLTLILGGVSIANTMTIAVIQRTPEIGIRRAVGFSPRYLATFFATQSAIQGAIGGVVGTAVGATVCMTYQYFQGMPLIVNETVTLAGPFLGLFVGVIGGAIPSFQASKIAPAQAVRG